MGVRCRGSPFSLDNRLTDGGKVVCFTHWLPFTPQEDSWYSFLLEAEFFCIVFMIYCVHVIALCCYYCIVLLHHLCTRALAYTCVIV
jgi:hypothetical protein